jgi:hypothetical protein
LRIGEWRLSRLLAVCAARYNVTPCAAVQIVTRGGGVGWEGPTLGTLGGLALLAGLAWAAVVVSRRRWEAAVTSLRFEDISLEDAGPGAVLGRGAQGYVGRGQWRGGTVAVKRLNLDAVRTRAR